jgi:hypothetical protein
VAPFVGPYVEDQVRKHFPVVGIGGTTNAAPLLPKQRALAPCANTGNLKAVVCRLA